MYLLLRLLAYLSCLALMDAEGRLCSMMTIMELDPPNMPRPHHRPNPCFDVDLVSNSTVLQQRRCLAHTHALSDTLTYACSCAGVTQLDVRAHSTSVVQNGTRSFHADVMRMF